MKFAVICGPMAAAVLLLAATPGFALNPQPEPPGKQQAHDLDMSVQHTTAATTTATNHDCGSGQVATDGTGNAAGAPAGTTGRNNSASTGGINTSLMTNIDKCHTPGASNMNPAVTTPPNASH